MARDSLAREAVRKTAVGRFDSGPCLFGAHAVDGRGRLAPGRVEARRLSPTFNGVDAGSNPARRTIGGSSIGRALNDPVRASTFAHLPVVPGRRHRACGAGTGRRPPVTCLEKQKPSGSRCLIRAGTGGAAGRVEDGRLSRDPESQQVRVLLPVITSAWAVQPQSVRGEFRLPDPTSARAATLQPHHIRPDGRAEPK